MNSIGKKRRLVFRLKKTTPLYFLYTVFVFVLAHCIWPNYQSRFFLIYQYVLDANFDKTLICFLLAFIMFCVINNDYTSGDTFSEKTILFLTTLYFIPGLAICSALNIDWDYIAVYVAYFIVLVIADSVIGHPTKAPVPINEGRAKIVLPALIAVCVLYPFVLMAVYDKGFSFENVIQTLNDPYEIRAQAREQGVSWAFLLLENWGVYFGALMITYTLKKKKFWLSVVFIIIQLFYFSLQGNRIFLFIAGIAIVLGVGKLTDKRVAVVLLGLIIAQFVEFFLFQGAEDLGIVTNIFRRFTLVPNIISPKYYDFFTVNTPDFLRGHFETISRLLGLESQYGFDVGYVIGKQYFNMEINANTGMVGGAFFEFGYWGIIIDPIMTILSLRLFEKVLMRAEKHYSALIAFIYTALAINSWALWSQCIRISYMVLFIISIYLLFNTEKTVRTPESLKGYRR